MQDKKTTYKGIFYLAAGEAVVAVIVVAIYLLVSSFSYKVITGVLLGVVVSVLNYTVLTVSVNRAVDKFMALRGDGEMDDETAEKFAAEHVGEIKNAQKLSYVVRTFTILGSLMLAFLSKQFEVIATVIPLLLSQPVIVVTQNIALKRGKNV